MLIRSAAPAVLALAALAGCLPASAQNKPAATVDAGVVTAPGKGVAARTIKTSATIVVIEPATREVTLRRQDGQVTTVTLGDEVRNFDQLKVGDKVHVEYAQALALELKKGAGGASASGSEMAKRAEPGQKPGGAVARQVTIVAEVVKVDAKNRTVTLKGPKGNRVDLDVEDPEQLKMVKAGDKIEAVYTEALAIKVEPAK